MVANRFLKSQYMWFPRVLVFITAVTALLFGVDAFGGDYLSHNFEIVTMTLIFINTSLLVVIAAILVKIESDLSDHDEGIRSLHYEHAQALADFHEAHIDAIRQITPKEAKSTSTARRSKK